MDGAVRLSNDWCWPYSQSMLPQSSTAACHTSLGIFSGLDAELAGSTAAVAEGPVSICVNIGAWSDYVASGAVMTQAACGSYSAYGLSRWVVSEPLSSCSAAGQIVRLSCSSSGLQTANQFVDSTSKMQTITSQLGYHCNGQADNTVNKGSGVSCSGDVASCDSSTCCEAPATCATTPSDCNGQADNTVNKGPDASCSGDAASCDSSTSCEAPPRLAPRHRFIALEKPPTQCTMAPVSAIACGAACHRSSGWVSCASTNAISIKICNVFQFSGLGVTGCLSSVA